MVKIDREPYGLGSYYSLAPSRSLKQQIVHPANSNLLGELTTELGFIPVGEHPTRRSHWQLLEQTGYPIPTFPKGEIKRNALVAMYQHEKHPTALMTVSGNKIDIDQVAEDLDIFTKYYVERPRVLGFPSWVLTSDWGIYPGILAGAGLGALGDEIVQLIHGGLGIPEMEVGATFGVIIASLSAQGIGSVVEGYATRKVAPILNRYADADKALVFLSGEQREISSTLIHNEVFKSMRKGGVGPSPEMYIDRVGENLPRVTKLFEQRRRQFEVQRQMGARGLPYQPDDQVREKLIKLAETLYQVAA